MMIDKNVTSGCFHRTKSVSLKDTLRADEVPRALTFALPPCFRRGIFLGMVVTAISFAFLLRVPYAQAGVMTYAVIGDFGTDTVSVDYAARELAVSNMVKSWNPNFILTVGDNNYESGSESTMDQNVGKHYQEYIGNYQGNHGSGAGNGLGDNRFFPVPGNHDWKAAGLQPYLDYFDLPGAGYTNTSDNERYYDFVSGDAHFFMLDSDDDINKEPDGTLVGSVQANWLQTQLAASTSKWNFVTLHHAPFSSGSHGSQDEMQLPYQEWGADAVFAGHDHNLERVVIGDFPYFVSGAGGKKSRTMPTVISGSEFRNDTENGALQVTLDGDLATFEFYAVDGITGQLLDTFTIDKNAPKPVRVSFQHGVDDYTGTVDTFIQENAPTANSSVAVELGFDGDDPSGSGLAVQALIRFDDIFGDGPGQIPLDSQIAYAKLELNVTNEGDSFELHRMMTSWDDTATWDSLVDGVQADGVEAMGVIDETSGFVSTGIAPIDVTDSLLAWQADPSSNHGWVLLPTGGNGVDFHSAEGINAPRLVIGLHPIPEPTSLTLAMIAGFSVLLFRQRKYHF